MPATNDEIEGFRIFLHRLAREANGKKRKWRKELTKFHDKRQAEKTACKEAWKRSAKTIAERIAKLDFILNKEKIPGLKGQHLKD